MDIIFVLLALLVTPLFFSPVKFSDGYILPQIAVGSILMGISVVFFAVRGMFPVDFLSIMAMLYFGYLCLSGTWSTVSHSSMLDVPLVFMSLSAFVVIRALVSINIGCVDLICYVVTGAGTFAALYGIGQKFLYDPLFPERLRPVKSSYEGMDESLVPDFFKNSKWIDSRAISTLGNTNFASGYFCSVLPFIIYLMLEKSLWFGIVLGIVLAGIVATKSRAGFLSVGVSIIVFLMLAAQRGLLLDWFLLLCSSPGLSALAFILVAYIGSEFLLRTHGFWKRLIKDNEINTLLDIEHTHQDHPVAHLRYRLRYWAAAFRLIRKRPLCGYGLRTYRREIYDAQSDLNAESRGEFLGYGYQTPQPRECHNDYIENFVEGGVIGGLFFLLIVGYCVFGIDIYSDSFLTNIGFASGVSASLVNAFFFFPFRLASSSITTWSALGIMSGLNGDGAVLVPVDYSPAIAIFILLIICAIVWEGAIKPNLANHYFSRYWFSKSAERKEVYLQKCLNLRPMDTVFRMHAFLGYSEVFPDQAAQHADVMRHHFDGMSTAWAVMYNSALAKLGLKDFDAAERFLCKALYYLPYFQEAKEELGRVSLFTSLPKRSVILKRISDQAIGMMQAISNEREKFLILANAKMADMANVILTEKIKMNIPLEWVFDFEKSIFLSPREVPQDRPMAYIGAARVPILFPMEINMQPQQKKEGE